MKKNYKLLKSLLPIVAVTSMVPTTLLFASCTGQNSKKEDQKKKGTKLNFAALPGEIDSWAQNIPTTLLCNNAPFSIKLHKSDTTVTAADGYYRYSVWSPVKEKLIWTQFVKMDADTVLNFPKGTYVQIVGYGESLSKIGFSNENLTQSFVISSSEADAKVSIGGNVNSFCMCDDPTTIEPEDPYALCHEEDELDAYCYQGLFENSTALYEVSTNFLPNKISQEGCYKNMFKGCTNLEIAPSINLHTRLCYISSTTNARSPDEIWGVEANACEGMFEECTNLQLAPYLPAIVLGTNCYKNMFKGCSSLNTISLAYVGNFTSNYFNGWVNGVNSKGKIYYNGIDEAKSESYEIPSNFEVVTDETIKSETIKLKLVSDGNSSKVTDSKPEFAVYKDMPSYLLQFLPQTAVGSYTYDYSSLPSFKDDPEKGLELCGLIDGNGDEIVQDLNSSRLDWYDNEGTTMEEIYNAGGTIAPVYGSIQKIDSRVVNIIANADSKITITKASSKNTKLFKYDTSSEKFVELTDTTISLIKGEMIQIVGKLANTSTTHTNFKITGDVTLTGDLGSLLKNSDLAGKGLDNVESDSVKNYTYAYYGLFQGSTGITNIKETTEKPLLPDTVLGKGCYDIMFEGCTNLKKAPLLPATTLAADCYFGMFKNCTSLVEACELPATTLADAKIDDDYYGGVYEQMFMNCTSLTKAPSILPAETIERLAYTGMFKNCSSLKVPPVIKAKSVKSDWEDYDDCEEIYDGVFKSRLFGLWTYVGPMSDMFDGCTSLYVVKHDVSTGGTTFFTCPVHDDDDATVLCMFKDTVKGSDVEEPEEGYTYAYIA